MVYRNTDSDRVLHTLEDFTEYRLRLRRGTGIFRDPAIEYPYEVSDSDGLSFREPSSTERHELAQMVWSTRGLTVINCPTKCEFRVQIDDIWWCRACSALWTSEESGHCYGRDLTLTATQEKIREITSRVKNNGLPGNWQPGYMELYHTLHKQAHEYTDSFYDRRMRTSLYDMAIIEVDQWGYDGIFFCTVSRDEDGLIWVRWESSA